ncbi:MAG: hypothetical protein COC01_08755 [Bacteroidetes bacterium]|nr:MAG: hypothetical protein COC01_08755 [Bacteroidota bacterium]
MIQSKKTGTKKKQKTIPSKKIKFPKEITPTLKKKLEQYIAFEEILYNMEFWGCLPNSFWDNVEAWKILVKRIYPMLDKPVALAIILSEIQFVHDGYVLVKSRINNVDPYMTTGASGLLMSLKLFEQNKYHIEGIRITYKGSKFPKEGTKSRLPIHLVRENKPLHPKQIYVTGIETITELYYLIEQNRTRFEQLAIREKKYAKKQYKMIKDSYNMETLTRKVFIPCIDKFLFDHLIFESPRQRHLDGVGLFCYLELMPQSNKPFYNHRKFEDRLLSNYTKYL